MTLAADRRLHKFRQILILCHVPLQPWGCGIAEQAIAQCAGALTIRVCVSMHASEGQSTYGDVEARGLCGQQALSRMAGWALAVRQSTGGNCGVYNELAPYARCDCPHVQSVSMFAMLGLLHLANVKPPTLRPRLASDAQHWHLESC